MRRISFFLAAASLLLAAAPPAQGQVAWDGPLLLSPSSPSGLGMYLTDPMPGDGIGFLLTWRGSQSIGFRAGIAEGFAGELAVYGAVDASGRLISQTEEFPLDMDWVTGAGVGVGEAALLSFPLGISIGRAIEAEDVWFNPYVAPRVVLDAWMGDQRPQDGLELNAALDIGVDIAFRPGWTVRFGASVGDREALAIGFGFRGP